MFICPPCNFPKYCRYRRISNYCFMAKGDYIFDNYLTVAFAIFMSFWGRLWHARINYRDYK